MEHTSAQVRSGDSMAAHLPQRMSQQVADRIIEGRRSWLGRP